MKQLEWVHVRADANHMATTFEFRISCARPDAPRASQILDECHAVVSRLERELSEFLPESPVFVLNAAPMGVPVAVPPSVFELLERSEHLRVRTRNAFHCTAKSPAHVPLPAVAWNRARGTAWKLHPDARVGFGAIGKGYALDCIRARIESQGFTDYSLSAGGSSIVLSGYAGPGEPWKWGWSWMKDSDGSPLGLPLTHPTGTPLALGVSGTHEKGGHIRSDRFESGSNAPKSASKSSPKSSLVALPSAADADALSTALFVAGWEKGQEILGADLLPPAVACIDPEGVPRWNGIFQKLFGSLGMVALALLSGVARADDVVDLATGASDGFTPYLVERNAAWAFLPALFGAYTLLHLKKNRKPEKRRNSK